MELQVKLNKNYEFEIIDVNNKIDVRVKNLLNKLINERENFNNDYMYDLSVYRTKRFQNYFIQIISHVELDVVDYVNAYLKAIDDEMNAIEAKEGEDFYAEIRKELDALAA